MFLHEGNNSPPAQQQVAPEMVSSSLSIFLSRLQGRINKVVSNESFMEMKFPEEIHGDIESNELEFSIEKTRANLENLKFQGIFDAFGSDHFATPGSPGLFLEQFVEHFEVPDDKIYSINSRTEIKIHSQL